LNKYSFEIGGGKVDATELSRILQNRRASAGQSPMQVRVLLNLNCSMPFLEKTLSGIFIFQIRI